jgi:4-hydroxybenzoate polyprenyltransferase
MMRLVEALRSHPLRARVEDYTRLSRWDRPLDLFMLLWGLLAATWLASAGAPDNLALLGLLIAVLLLRTAARIWLNRSEVQRVALGMVLAGLVFVIPLGWPLLLLPLSLASAAAAFFFQKKTYLAQTGFAFGAAWLVPTAYLSQGAVPGKAAWLLFIAVLFWATSQVLLAYLPRPAKDAEQGLLTLPMLFGKFARQAVAGFQLLALLSLYLLGHQLDLKIFFTLGLASAAALTLYQQYLLFYRPDREGWRLALAVSVWWGIAIFCGVAFHYLCACA